MPGRLLRCRAVMVLAATFAGGLLGSASAQAGTLTVNATASSGCSLFSVSGGGPWFLYTLPCRGEQIGFAGGGFSTPAPAGARIGMQTNAPPGITINSASSTPGRFINLNDGQGWGGGSYWSGGGSGWPSNPPGDVLDGPFSSSYWGFQIICGWSSCTNTGSIFLSAVQITATENQGPGLVAVGANNLWYQSRRWVWNAPGDPWAIPLAASDPSGVCNMWAIIDSVRQVQGPSAAPNTSQWQQCPEPTWTTGQGAVVDTRDYIRGAGKLSLALGASNAAGVPSQVSETLNVDNDPVGVSLTTPNDANPSVWVNHAVNAAARPTAGPSGIGGMNCTTDRASARPYPASGLTVDGDGVHNVSCTAWNKAVDPEGGPATGAASTRVHIDEAPPVMSFEPQNPGDPARLTIDTADIESGAGGGSIEMAPSGSSNWSALPTTFDGHHLLADINDSSLSGTYTVRATACDKVGNCASSDEDLRLPLRLAASSEVSFAKIEAPALTVGRRVLVGWHYMHVKRHHQVTRIKTGGHYITVHIVIRRNAACAHTLVRTGPHRWREITACRPLKIKTLTSERVGYGKHATVHGLLISTQGVPIANAPVQVLAAPDNGLGQFSRVASVSTDSRGGWSATLPPGPSRIVRAVYGGSPTLLPASGTVRTIVPARVRLISISPRHVAWGGTVRIVGRLDGGYLPSGGALVRLRIGSGSAFTTYGVKEHVTGNGRFSTTYTFGLGDPSVYNSYWFQIASLPMGDYPWAPADSRRLTVLVGGHPHRGT